jgi:arylsulfatase A-like enzyme
VETIDKEIGKIISVLDKQKLWDNTIVIFSSDHGDGNAAHHWNQKSALYEETANIPFIVRLPDQQARGIVKDQLVNNGIDLFATLCDYAGVALPPYCLGKSLKNVLEGKNQNFNEAVITETLFDEGITKGWMVRTKDYKYILYDKGRYREQLYDMRTDRPEMVNLAIEKKYVNILNEHRQLLNNWHEKNNIPKDRRATPR